MKLKLADLSDERRSKKPWLPQDDRDVTNGLVVADGFGKPSCVLHGAMNRVHPTERFYRCSEFRCGVGAQMIETFEISDLTVDQQGDLV